MIFKSDQWICSKRDHCQSSGVHLPMVIVSILPHAEFGRSVTDLMTIEKTRPTLKFLFDTNPWIKLPFIKHWLNLTFVTLFDWARISDSEMRLSKLASHFEQFSSRGVTVNKQSDSWNMQIARKHARIIRSIYQARLVKLGPEVSRKFENFLINGKDCLYHESDCLFTVAPLEKNCSKWDASFDTHFWVRNSGSVK